MASLSFLIEPREAVTATAREDGLGDNLRSKILNSEKLNKRETVEKKKKRFLVYRLAPPPSDPAPI